MIVELISVGTELLLGNIVNTNAAYLAEQCAGLGLSCFFQSVVGDNGDRLKHVLQTAMERSDVVILSGGLGPTEDDLTKEIAAEACEKKLVLHEPSRAVIEEYFKKKGVEPTGNNWKQAMLPEGCLVMGNPNGTAPGVIIETEQAKVLLFPGPPGELRSMFEAYARPYLAGLSLQVIRSRTVKVCGVGESSVETLIMDMIDGQSNPTLATYAKTGEVHIRVTAKAENEKAADALVQPVVEELQRRFGEAVYSTEDGETLEKTLLDLLRENEMTITCAESCTGGMLSARLINVAGASDVYRVGLVTYANEAKSRFLGVRETTLRTYGAVSTQTAEEMALGAAAAAEADVSVAVTGIAGPDGGTKEKPVGLVYIACYVRGKTTVRQYHFAGNRTKVREAAVAAALSLARSCILQNLL